MTYAVILPKGEREPALRRVAMMVASLAQDKAWRVEAREHKDTRTNEQNRLLWALYDDILELGGEAMGGWTRADLHEFFLIEHFGSERKTLFGRSRLTPLRRSSALGIQEFSDLVEHIIRFMAEQGVVLKLPTDNWSA